MSALPPKADMCSALVHVRFVPIADIDGDSRMSALCHTRHRQLLNHFIGAGEKRRWQGQPERLCGLAVDQQSVFRRQHDR